MNVTPPPWPVRVGRHRLVGRVRGRDAFEAPSHASFWQAFPQKYTVLHPMQRDLAPAFPQARQVLTPRALRAAVTFCMFSMARF